MKKAEKTRHFILTKAEELLIQQPIDQLTVEQIAAEAGVHRSTFYRHFPAFSDLILALIEEKLSEPIAEITTVEETLLCILELIEENFIFFRHIALGIEPLNLHFQVLLVDSLIAVKPIGGAIIDRENRAEVEMIYQTAVAIFSTWLLKPQMIQKADVLAFLEKYFNFFE